MSLTRRTVLAGLLGGAAGVAFGRAPEQAPRPAARGGAASAAVQRPVAGVSDLVAAARLGGVVGFVVADMATGAVLEERMADVPMPPASTLKVITSLYALDQLGRDYRFPTRLFATGPIEGGRIAGDLILAGGGDPDLTTDDLAALASALKAKGVRSVAGRFLVWGGALAPVAAIDPAQPAWLGYNPAISGLNLNYNRVNFTWKRKPGGYDAGFDAPGERYAPPVHTATMKIAERAGPVFTYSPGAATEDWTVAAEALGKGGSRWLPVRRPELYAGDVFRTLARGQGIDLPEPALSAAAPQGQVLVAQAGEPLPLVLSAMMKYSTNITAEAVGMAASQRAGVIGHDASARAMAAWLAARTGSAGAAFTDHSGLGGGSRISPRTMLAALMMLGPAEGLRPLMKDFSFRDADGRKQARHPIEVSAKTGTLNFVSTLAGYISTPGGRELAFTIFSGDTARRDAVPDAEKERPAGGRAWIGRSKHLQQELIERWSALYGA